MSTNKAAKVLSCTSCRRRKVTCDKRSPCSYCLSHDLQCSPTAPAVPRQRKKRFPEAELLARIRRYEAVLESYGADIEKIKSESATENGDKDIIRHAKLSKRSISDNIAVKPNDDAEDNFAKNLEDGVNLFIKICIRALIIFLEFQELLLGSSDSELDSDQNLATISYNQIFINEGQNLLFNFDQKSINLTAFHPPPLHIFSLWQTYIENVDPVIKILHIPSLQQEIIKASTNIEIITNEMHALMFGIYSMAVKSLEDDDCILAYNEDKETLLSKFQFGAQNSLWRSDFLRSSDLGVLQALVLYLYSIVKQVDPRSLFCLTAIADRIARKISLHYERGRSSTTPFLREMKRRLWWQIVFLDSRIAEMSGSGPIALPNIPSARLPLNINNSELDSGMSSTPIQSLHSTDMILCLIQCEVAECFRKLRSTDYIDGRRKLNRSTSSAFERKLLINEFDSMLTEKYLKYCDSTVSLHILAKYVALFSVGKMRVTVHHEFLRRESGDIVTNKDRDYIFQVCLDVLEFHAAIRSDSKLKGFFWYLRMNMPVTIFLHLLIALREQPTGPLADRAWAAIFQILAHFVHPQAIGSTSSVSDAGDSKLQLAYANLVVKAWAARESSSQSASPTSTPSAILYFKEKLAGKRSQNTTPNQANSTPSSEVDGQTQHANILGITMRQPPGSNSRQASLINIEGSDTISALQSSDVSIPVDMLYWDNFFIENDLIEDAFMEDQLLSMFQ